MNAGVLQNRCCTRTEHWRVGGLHRWLRRVGRGWPVERVGSRSDGGFGYGTAFVFRRACGDRGDDRGGIGSRADSAAVGQAPVDGPARVGGQRRPCGYRAGVAHRAACSRARRPEAAKLAGHVELAAKVAKRLKSRWSPHAISADPRAGHMTISAEAVYRACYDPTGRRRLPSRHRRRKPPLRISGWSEGVEQCPVGFACV